MTQALTEQQRDMWSEDQKQLIKRTVATDTTDDEFLMFLHYCQESGLDPLRKQAHCIVNEWTDRQGKTRRDVQMMTGIDGFRSRAEQMPDYLGCQSAVVWDCDKFEMDFATQDVTHSAKFPRAQNAKIIGAWCIVRRQGRPQYLHWLPWQELYNGRSPTHQKMPEIMAKKTSEAQALRHEYPEKFSGMYDLAEIPSKQGDALLLKGHDGDDSSEVHVHGGSGADSSGLEQSTEQRAGEHDGSNASTEQAVEAARPEAESGNTTESGRDDREPQLPVDGDDDNAEGDNGNEQPAASESDVAGFGPALPDTPDADSTDATAPDTDQADRATDAQATRFKELMTWAYEHNLMGDNVYSAACAWIEIAGEEPDTFVINPVRTQGEVGAKIGVWKERRARYEATEEVATDLDKFIDESGLGEDVAKQAHDTFRQHVMTGEKKWDFCAYASELTKQATPDPDDLPL